MMKANQYKHGIIQTFTLGWVFIVFLVGASFVTSFCTNLKICL
jgi:hypothetical protein